MHLRGIFQTQVEWFYAFSCCVDMTVSSHENGLACRFDYVGFKEYNFNRL